MDWMGKTDDVDDERSYLPRWFRMKYGSFARSMVSSASLRSLSLRSMASCCVEQT